MSDVLADDDGGAEPVLVHRSSINGSCGDTPSVDTGYSDSNESAAGYQTSGAPRTRLSSSLVRVLMRRGAVRVAAGDPGPAPP